MNKQLLQYIENNVFPIYSKNEEGHQMSHIQYVIDRSLRFAKQAEEKLGYNGTNLEKINYDMVYVIAAYHDIGHHIDRKKHEIVSAEIMFNDNSLRQWFNEDEIKVIYDAIVDHRASNGQEPRTIYGKIVSSADRNVDIETIFTRTYTYRKNAYPNMTDAEIEDEAYRHISEKFGENGYAVEKMYFEDKEYEAFLQSVRAVLSSKGAFRKAFYSINGLNKDGLKQKIENYQPWNEQEITDKALMLKFIDTFADVVTRENQFGHFTASAFVVDEYCSKALMLHHNIMNDWIYPGGHADGEYDLYSVALREVQEETGLTVYPMFDKEIFAIQAAPVKGHIKNGKYVPAHIHYDVLFVFKAKKEDMNKIRILANENKSVEWWDICDTFTNPNVVDWAIPVNRKIVQKLGY